ncbi:MAG: hydrogenase iron-sulfur subunit [Candidatus Bathyarchaeota archaeon]|nr:hydrogenase iron-sulfur subunit [Candidatus Bathyarchaeota archaeon]MDH5418827.1 hydrogenase iron-sulfur subunit [Candidatus Bathyarchaeota archaeon]MDH5623277.1 hydrogenase iron-sulfur subunit [Candidatus Bathyarchaeota archaeon]MDH5635085.1 hydrogenase iron-sulfur subunit [Candidatus Bathyarchaeota archaeon]MDH5701976.1 hydrogenase iron-sulfur subunit [Candidatus Bathyarchaeota archaeon]
MTEEFEPKIVGFLCNWCSYAGADLAGVSRIQYPPNLRIIRVMCSGRVDPAFILEAFRSGADGVLIAGCHPGDCHYIAGNYKAQRRGILLKKLLEQFGVEPQRLKIEFVSASEGAKFAAVVKEMVETIKKLGPSPLKVQMEGLTYASG